MVKDNAQLQRDKRAKEKALLDRIGAEKRSLIVSKALADVLMRLASVMTSRKEKLSTFLIKLTAAPDEKSARFATVSRPDIVMTEK